MLVLLVSSLESKMLGANFSRPPSRTQQVCKVLFGEAGNSCKVLTIVLQQIFCKFVAHGPMALFFFQIEFVAHSTMMLLLRQSFRFSFSVRFNMLSSCSKRFYIL